MTANKLKTHDKLLLSDGKPVTIDSIEVEELVTPETTYNFEVEDFHTYYVTDSKVLVHNTCAKIDGKGYKSESFHVDGEVGPYNDVRVDVEYAGANRYTMHLQYKSGPSGSGKLPFDTYINKFVGKGADVFNSSHKVRKAVVRASKYIKGFGGVLHW